MPSSSPSCPAAELRGIRELQTYGAAVIGVVVVAAAACAWFLAGRVLRPVRELTETARSISESNQAERIRVSRSGEAAEMAETFNEMLDRLNAASVNQRDFLRAAGHELRAPLTVATGHLELLADGTVEQQATLPLVIDELSRMGKILDDLQSLTGATAPGLPRSGADRRRAVRPRAARQGDGPGGAVVALGRGDARDVRRRSLPPHRGGAQPRRQRRQEHRARRHDRASGCALGDDEVRLWVRDTGPGVAPDDAERVFERFTRGQGANRRYRGAGLGLSIVQSIAAAHGGRVELASRPGSGATFTIVLPVDATDRIDGGAGGCRGS